MSADGQTALDAINWGTSTGGAAGAAETTSTLGVDRSDVRVPPSTSYVWGAQINNLKSVVGAMSTTFKGGTRLGALTQTASPFGVSEYGFWVDTSGVPWFANAGTSVRVGTATGTAAAQATNINTAVTCNGASGIITTQSATTAARTAESGFTVTNPSVLSTSVVIARVVAYSGTIFTNGQPDVDVTAVAAGSFNIRVINRDATNALSGTMKIHFIVQ